jgi:hypothetical protein
MEGYRRYPSGWVGARPGSERTARRELGRIEGKHGVELNLAVLHRRRALHRAGHECGTVILPMMAFVHVWSATAGRQARYQAGCSGARVAAVR